MIKIVGICGSPRKKSSYKALEAALAAAKSTDEDVEVELVELRTRKMNFCIHCNKCLKENSDRCTIYQDDMTELYDKVYQADGIIVASPVYEMNITAQLATFFGRFRSAWMLSIKDPDFFTRKVGGGIAVGGTRNGGQEHTLNSILGFFYTQGFTICNGGNGMYNGPALWNPGDGSGEMDDEIGMKDAENLGKKVAKMARIMKNANI